MSDKIYKAKILEWLENAIQQSRLAAKGCSEKERYDEENLELARAEAFGTTYSTIKRTQFDVEKELFSLSEMYSCWTEAESSAPIKKKNGFANFINAIKNEREKYENHPVIWGGDEDEDEH